MDLRSGLVAKITAGPNFFGLGCFFAVVYITALRSLAMKTYKKYEPEISNGKITRNNEFYTLTEYRNGNKTDFNWTVKITNKRLNFYYPNKNEKLRKSAKYKRIL